MTAFAPHPAGTDDLVKRLMAENLSQEIEYFNRIERLEAALTRANAATAAAYERAARAIDEDGEYVRSIGLSNRIHALATPDQSAALDAVRAEARAQGMREAAKICQTLGPLGGVTPNPRAEWKTHADNLAHAILAAIKGAKA